MRVNTLIWFVLLVLTGCGGRQMRGIDSSDTLVVKSSPVETEKLTAHLYPDVHPNKPGRYRYFKEITIGDNREKILLMAEVLMAEFRLED